MTRPRLRYYTRLTLIVLVFAAAGGAIFRVVADDGDWLLKMAQGGFVGIAIALPITILEIALASWRSLAGVRRAPFALLLLGRTACYLAIILCGLALGHFALGSPGEPGLLESPGFRGSLIFSLVAAFAFNFVNQIARMLGRGVLGNFILGRYHRPRREERVFMLIDLRQSTAIAERIGDLAFHDLLNEFFSHVADAASETGAVIHKYVGDEAILAWSPRRARRNGDCVRCFFILRRDIEAAAARYTRKFGVVPQFRAGLHRGPVVVGEIGVTKQEIAYSGDTLNTAARIEQATRDFNVDLLASDAALLAMKLPDGCVARSVGHLQLRGKSEQTELFAIDAA